jgi:hypothetical protein
VNFEDNSKDLSDFFNTISAGKQKRKKELQETVGDSVNDFFQTISIGKKIEKEKKESLVGDSFETLFLSKLEEGKKQTKKKKLQEQVIENSLDDVFEEYKEQLEDHKEDLIEKSLGILAEPSEVKQQNDPLTPLNQNFATLDDLQKHYKLFLSRIQQQLSTLGGGGETNLAYMDMPLKYITTSSYTITPQDYYIGVNYAGAVTITLPTPRKDGKVYIVKDELGEASKGINRYITILPSGPDTIDGRDRAIIAYDYGSLTFVYRNGWRVV